VGARVCVHKGGGVVGGGCLGGDGLGGGVWVLEFFVGVLSRVFVK